MLKLPKHIQEYYESAEHQEFVRKTIAEFQALRDSADKRWMAKFGRPFINGVDDFSELLAANGESISAIVDPNSPLANAPAHQVVRLLEKKMEAEQKRVAAPQVIDDSKWRTVTQVANGLGINKGQVPRLIKRGCLRDNGKSGTPRRIDPASVLEYCDREGIAYNDT